MFFLGNVQEELDHAGPLVGQQFLERIDLIVTPSPDLRRYEFVDPDHQHVFVVAAIEDADLAPRRGVGVDAPEVVVGQLQMARLLERGNPNTLGVDHAEDVADGAVFTGGVHPLKNDQ